LTTGAAARVSHVSSESPSGPQLIVADDLGSWPRKTDAIVSALESGMITSASIMANFADFERACALVSDKGLENRVGAHLVLTEGVPLTARIRRSSRFCDDDGLFRGDLDTRRVLHLGSRERELVAGELRAQCQKMRDNGLPIAHLDSHHHVHIQPAISTIVSRLALELEVPHVRLAPNVMRRASLRYRVYSSYHNRRLRRHGLAATRYTGSLREVLALAPEDRPTDDFELIVHPILVNGEIEDQAVPGKLLRDLISTCLGGDTTRVR